ncbi:MAG TPA: hypothetical protein PLF81_29930 [Candidatus Anammoximicrobium sp.]|nr:hypothetical protein [Candidatus Anammoximicrobium sp.]
MSRPPPLWPVALASRRSRLAACPLAAIRRVLAAGAADGRQTVVALQAGPKLEAFEQVGDW